MKKRRRGVVSKKRFEELEERVERCVTILGELETQIKHDRNIWMFHKHNENGRLILP